MVSAVVGSGADVVSVAVVVGCVVGSVVGTVDIAVVVCGAPVVDVTGVVSLDKDCRITWSLEKDHQAQDQQVSGSNPPSHCR